MNAPSTTGPGFAAPRVMPNAAHALGGIWRLTFRRTFTGGHWLALAGMLVLLVLFSFPATHSRESAARAFLPWAGAFYICFLVPVLAFISAAGAMRDELKAGTVDYVFTRPIRRPLFVVFRYLAHLGCAQIDFLLALGVVVAIGLFRDVPEMSAALPRLLVAQMLVVTTFSAFGFLCGVLTSRYIILGLLYGGIIEVGIGNVPTQLNRISMIRHAIGILQPIVGSRPTGMGGSLMTAPLSATGSTLVLLVVSAVMIAATALLFSLKELAGSGRET